MAKVKKKKSKLILGADPGKSGAVVLLKKDSGKIFNWMDALPAKKEAKPEPEPGELDPNMFG